MTSGAWFPQPSQTKRFWMSKSSAVFHVKLSLVRQLLAVMFGLKENPHDNLIWNSNEFETPDPNGTLAGCYRNQPKVWRKTREARGYWHHYDLRGLLDLSVMTSWLKTSAKKTQLSGQRCCIPWRHLCLWLVRDRVCNREHLCTGSATHGPVSAECCRREVLVELLRFWAKPFRTRKMSNGLWDNYPSGNISTIGTGTHANHLK